jgi:mRNA-degrading endonuclease RelE of RelBE toxin-antitoxin system
MVHLSHSGPAEETRNRFRLRRPSQHAGYELRIGDWRVFYRIQEGLVEVLMVGEKRGNRLVIGGEEFNL